MKKTLLFITVVFVVILQIGCAIAPEDITGQQFVGDDEFKTAVFVKEGLIHAQNQKFVDSEFAFTRAQYINPDADIIKFNLAVVWLFQERYEEALNSFLNLYEKDRLNPAYRIWYARALVANNHYSAGLSLLIEGEEGALLKGDWALASVYSQAQSGILFNAGYEEEALCSSSRSFNQLQTPENVYLLSRVQTALGLGTSSANTLKEFLIANFQAVTKNIRYQESILRYDSGLYKEAIDLAKESFVLPPNDEKIEKKAQAMLVLSDNKLTRREISSEELVEVTSALSDDILYFPKSILDVLQKSTNFRRAKGHILSDLINRALEYFAGRR